MKRLNQSSEVLYSQDKFSKLLSNLQSVNKEAAIIDCVQQLAEFLCYSQRYELSYFEQFMDSPVMDSLLPYFMSLNCTAIHI